jgi:signal transduction histidine kinase
MWVGVREISRLGGQRLPGLILVGGAVGLVWFLSLRRRAHARLRRYEERLEEEYAAYAHVDVSPVSGDAVDQAVRVSRLIAEKSAFRRVAMMVRATDVRLAVIGHAGMDPSLVQSLNAWGERFVAGQLDVENEVRYGNDWLGMSVGTKSFAVILGEMPETIGAQRVIVVPLRTAAGRILGVLAVGADGVIHARRTVLAKALKPMELLSFKLERTMEVAALQESLQRAEKSAELATMAEGIARALINPLTAVLGFGELMVDTAGDVRLKEDAEIIVQEALRMRQTLEQLLQLWRPEQRAEMVGAAERILV